MKGQNRTKDDPSI